MDEFSKWWTKEMEGRWIEHIQSYEMNGDKDRCKRAFTAAYSLGLAKGRKEGMEDIKQIAVDFFYWWYNSPHGTNTVDGFDEWWAIRQAAQGGEDQ